MAHAILASLLASAIAATLVGRRQQRREPRRPIPICVSVEFGGALELPLGHIHSVTVKPSVILQFLPEHWVIVLAHAEEPPGPVTYFCCARDLFHRGRALLLLVR